MIPERLGSLMAAVAVALAPLIGDAHAQHHLAIGTLGEPLNEARH